MPNGAMHAMATRKRVGTSTFVDFGRDVLDERELSGVRGVREERYVFDVHLATAHFAETPIDEIEPTDIARWVRDMKQKTAQDHRGARPLSKATILRAKAIASAIFVAAGPTIAGFSERTRAMTSMSAPASRRRRILTFLELDEQMAIRRCAGIAERDRVRTFAIGTGLRQGEGVNRAG